MSQKGWIFISHSHKDLDSVRIIRNSFEELGFEPLMFYLKCLSDEDEIEDLIKREIASREWFIYADSKNAKVSKWVQTEREYIEGFPDKKVFIIDLSKSKAEIKKQIIHITRQMKVFISYAKKDRAIFEMIRNRLVEKDMSVFDDEDLSISENITSEVKRNISDSCRNGFVLLLITEDMCRSEFIKKEVQYAIESKAKIVPIYIGKASLSTSMLSSLGSVQGVHLSEKPSDIEIDELIKDILHRVEYYHSDFTDSCGFRSAETIHLPPIAQIDNLTFWDCPNLKCVFVPDSVISISPDAFKEHKDILIKCSAGSYCETYCKHHSLKYEIIE